MLRPDVRGDLHLCNGGRVSCVWLKSGWNVSYRCRRRCPRPIVLGPGRNCSGNTVPPSVSFPEITEHVRWLQSAAIPRQHPFLSVSLLFPPTTWWKVIRSLGSPLFNTTNAHWTTFNYRNVYWYVEHNQVRDRSWNWLRTALSHSFQIMNAPALTERERDLISECSVCSFLIM